MFYLYFLLVILFIYLFSKLDKLMFKVLIFIFMTLIIVIAGLRYEIGTDYPTYRKIYFSLSLDNHKYIELGYGYVNLFFKYMNFSYEFTVFIFSLVINLLFYRFIKKHSVSLFFSLLLYVLLNYYFITFNAVRQMIAIGIFLNSIEYIFKKQYFKFIGITLLAALFHYVVLLAIIYPLFRIKKQYIFIFFWVLSLIFIVVPFQPIVIRILPSSFKYAGYLTSNLFQRTSSLSVFKLFLPNIFVLLSFYYKNAFKADSDRFWFNLFIVSIGGVNISNGIPLLLRLNYVFQISEIIFYPLCISKFAYKERALFSYVCLLYYILFYILTVLIQGAQGVVPYRSILFL